MPCPLAAVETKNLSVDGYSLAYKFVPSATPNNIPIFFVSGSFQVMASWSNFARYCLDRGTSVIVADLPGTGGSDPLPVEYGLDILVKAIKRILDDANVDQVSIIAVSYGTPAGYGFAQKYPDRVKNLVLAGFMKEIPAHMRQPTADTLIPLQAGDMPQFAKQVLAGLTPLDRNKEVNRQELVHRVLYAQLKKMSIQDREKYLLNTQRLLVHEPLDLQNPPTCRTLIFTGEHDCFTRPEYSKVCADAFPDCLFTTIANADHLFHIEQPEVTSELCYRFTQGDSIHTIKGINRIEVCGSAGS